MIRIVNFEIDGLPPIPFASMSWAEAERHVESGIPLLKEAEDFKISKPTKEQSDALNSKFLSRTLETVSMSMKKAAPSNLPTLSPAELKEQFDMPTINAMHMHVLKISGLTAGEGQATNQASPNLKVA